MRTSQIQIPWEEKIGMEAIKKRWQSLSCSFLMEHVRDVKSSKKMWQAIVNVFERQTLLDNLAARRKFYTDTMLPGNKVLYFVNSVRQLASVLKSMDL